MKSPIQHPFRELLDRIKVRHFRNLDWTRVSSIFLEVRGLIDRYLVTLAR